MIGALIFWGSFAAVAYTYVGYVLIMWLRGRARRPESYAASEPTVTIVVVAYNEGARIARRIENLLGLDYPRDRFDVVIVSDGSTDDTVRQARAYEAAGVRVVAFPARRGKPAALNDVIPTAAGEIVALGDARQRYDRGALRKLVEPFADARIGAVSGELMFERDDGCDTATEEGLGVYWRYEKLIRTAESAVDSTVGVTGAIYAIRRDLFETIPPDTLLDDVAIPMRIVRRGYRVVYQRGACAFDRAAANPEDEFIRKTRTIAGNFQLFLQEPWMLVPGVNRLWFQTVSHKLLRLLGPVFLLAMWFANCTLLDVALGRLTMAGQVGFYATAVAGHWFRRAPRRLRILAVPYVFCLLNVTTVVAFLRFVARSERVTWEKAPLESVESRPLTGAGPRK